MVIFVTGGSGFIGSNFIRLMLNETTHQIVNIDKLTYAGNPMNLLDFEKNKRYHFYKININNKKEIFNLFNKYNPQLVYNFAAESHVDRSIHGPKSFIETNINGVFNLLEIQRIYYESLSYSKKCKFKFVHISTDEVYGSLEKDENPFNEKNQFKPNSPYSASKAASDHLVRSWNRTYGLPTIISNCSNNYGPYQFPEKFIPLIISNLIDGKKIPIYGNGSNIRDWIFVEDHCRALKVIGEIGKVGEVYNIGADNELNNIQIANKVCDEFDKQFNNTISSRRLISFVSDRPGHDKRYAIDSFKIRHELNWKPLMDFDTGINKTLKWYLNNIKWLDSIKSGKYKKWLKMNYK